MSKTNEIQIKIETTPNPATLKFEFSETVLDQGFEFKTAQEAEVSPLASKIFGFPWTSSVYLGPNFLTVTKQDWVDWDILAEPLSNIIKSHLEAGEPVYVIYEESESEDGDESDENDSELVKKIKNVLRHSIRPMVARDGGDIIFVREDNGVVFVKLLGACSGCPSSQVTLKQGVEAQLRAVIPEIKQVRSV